MYAGEFLQVAYEEQYAASVERARNITPRRRFKCVSSFFSIFFPWRNITPRRSFKCISSFFLFFWTIFCSWRNITPRAAASSASPPLSLSLSLSDTHTHRYTYKELLDYGLSPEELEGRSLVALQALLKAEKGTELTDVELKTFEVAKVHDAESD
jgi:hypothetical protein